jgi:uncharacterized protein YgiM (DUF1202 family)
MDVMTISIWTKIAALFSIIASVFTIYEVAIAPKDAPPLLNVVMSSVGLTSKPKVTPAPAEICARVRRPVWPEQSWAVRVAPGNEHREIARIAPGDAVVIVSQTGDWSQIREQVGLGATVQGWTLNKAVDKTPCPKKP